MMNVEANELIEFFENIYAEESSAKDVIKQCKADLKEFAEKIDCSTKALNQAYKTFTMYKDGKMSDMDTSEFDTLGDIVEKYFS